MAQSSADKVLRARGFLFAVIALLVLQSAFAGFASAHSLGACAGHTRSAADSGHDHAGHGSVTHPHDGADAGHGHVAAGHTPNGGPASSHDHMNECCGWMCTAAVCTVAASLLPQIPPGQSPALQGGDAPLSPLASGLDRPPRLPLATI